MSLEVQSLRTMRSEILGLEGPHRQRPQRRTWPLIAAVVALGVALFLARRAAPSSGHRCADNADCPSMVCSAGRCR